MYRIATPRHTEYYTVGIGRYYYTHSMNFELLLATVSFTFGHINIPHTCTTYQFFSFDKILRRTCHVYLPGRYTYVNRISALSVVLMDLLKKKKN